MKTKMTKTGFRACLGASALAGLLVSGVPLTAAEAQETRQDTSAARQDTSTRTAAADTAQADSTQWGRPTDQEAEVQNPPGYRGMERPVNVFPPDTADTSSAGNATSRTSQLKRQDSISSENQNPPGYRGMERPVGTEITTDQQAKWQALLEAAQKQPNPTPELRDAINNLRKQPRDAEAQPTKKADTKKKAKTTKKLGQEPPPYPSDSEQVWVKQQPSGDSVAIGFDSTANKE
jgi:hypothetical protein